MTSFTLRAGAAQADGVINLAFGDKCPRSGLPRPGDRPGEHGPHRSRREAPHPLRQAARTVRHSATEQGSSSTPAGRAAARSAEEDLDLLIQIRVLVFGQLDRGAAGDCPLRLWDDESGRSLRVGRCLSPPAAWLRAPCRRPCGRAGRWWPCRSSPGRSGCGGDRVSARADRSRNVSGGSAGGSALRDCAGFAPRRSGHQGWWCLTAGRRAAEESRASGSGSNTGLPSAVAAPQATHTWNGLSRTCCPARASWDCMSKRVWPRLIRRITAVRQKSTPKVTVSCRHDPCSMRLVGMSTASIAVK